MSRKYKVGLASIFLLLIGVISVGVIVQRKENNIQELSENKQQADFEAYAQKLRSFDTEAMIQSARQEVSGQYVIPKNKAELEILFDGVLINKMPRIFVEKLPDDFSVETEDDRALFLKIVTALLLRTNEKVEKERQILLFLKDKYEHNVPWTAMEQEFFDYLVEKYDSVILRSLKGKVNSLFRKVDVLPVSIGVAQAVYFSDWGNKNKQSLFGEYGWIDKYNYVPLVYDSLSKASDNYVLQMNSREEMIMFWEIRRSYRPYAAERAIGSDLAFHTDKFMEWNGNYARELGHLLDSNGLEVLDFAVFEKEE